MPSQGPSLPLPPPPPSPASGGGWASPPPASSSLELLIVSFVLPTAGSVFGSCTFRWLIFSLSLLLSHSLSCCLALATSHCPQGIRPVITLSKATGSSPFSPQLLMVDASIWGTFLLGVAFRHVICGFYVFFLPVRLPSEIRKPPRDLPVRGFPGAWKLPLLQLASWDGSPSLNLLSLFLSFIFCPTSFRRQWAAFLGAWCPLLAIRSFFVQFAQHSNVLLMNL